MIYWDQAATIITAVIIALGTAALAIYAALTFRAIKDQMKLLYDQSDAMKRQADANEVQSGFIRDQSNALKSQAETMESQFEIIREESATMKRQADAMEGQANLMHESIEYDRLVKKYERANREISLLIGPLYARRNDANIFSLKCNRRGRISISPTMRTPDPSPDALIYDFVTFWDSIEQNMYLNRSPEVQFAFRNYSLNVIDYFQAVESSADAERKKDLEDLFHKTRKPDLIREIEKRYLELSDELKSLESELSERD